MTIGSAEPIGARASWWPPDAGPVEPEPAPPSTDAPTPVSHSVLDATAAATSPLLRHFAGRVPVPDASLGGVAEDLGRATVLPSGDFLLMSTAAGAQAVSAQMLMDLRQRAGEAMKGAARKIAGELDTVIDGWEVLQAADEAQPATALVSRILGDVAPFEKDLREAAAFTKVALGRFRLALDRGDLAEAARELEAAEVSVEGARRAWQATRDGIEGGAETAVVSLEHTRNAAAVTVGLLALVASSGGAAAGALTAGGSAHASATAVLANGIASAMPVAGALGETAARMNLDLQVDWVGTAKDAITGVVVARLGGEISQAVFQRLSGVPGVREMGRAAFARVLGSVVAHEAATAFQTTADAAYAAARGRAVTWQAYENQLFERLTDPKGIFVATVFGAVTARFAATSGQNIGPTRRVATGGARNERPLTQAQAEEALRYAEQLGMPKAAIKVSESMNAGYKSVFGQDVLYVGTDVLPSTRPRDANSRVSMKGALAHELVGHRRAELAGKSQASPVREEAQASIRAARFAPDLTFAERFTLLRDAVTRLHRAGLSVKDVREDLWIDEP